MFCSLSWHCKHISGQIFSILLHCTCMLTAGYCCNNCIVFRVLTRLQRMCLRWSIEESIRHYVKVWLGSFNVIYMQKSLQTYRQKMLSSAISSSKVWCLFRWRGQILQLLIHSSGDSWATGRMKRRSGCHLPSRTLTGRSHNLHVNLQQKWHKKIITINSSI